MTELIQALQARSDKIKATVVTRHYQLDGELHTPKTGKEQRRLSNILNSDRRFLAMTNVIITNLLTGRRDPNPCPFIQISINSVEFVRPHPDELDALAERE